MQDRRGYVPVALGKYQDSRENGIDRGRCVWILGFSLGGEDSLFKKALEEDIKTRPETDVSIKTNDI